MSNLTDLEIYPLPLGCDLRAEWVPLLWRRVKQENMRGRMTDAAFGVWWAVLMESLEQDPAGTLPDDDAALAFLAGFGRDATSWGVMRAEGALEGWAPVLCFPDGGTDADDAEIRLAHPIVFAMVEKSVAWLAQARERSRVGAERSNLSRVRAQMLKAGAHAGLVQREDFVGAVQARLDALRQRRTLPNVRAAMDHVSRELDGRRAGDAEKLAEIADMMRHRRH